MFAVALIIPWLIQSFLLSTGLIATGYLLARWCGPKRVRLRILQWTLCGTLAGLVIIALPRDWRMTVPVSVLPAMEVNAPRLVDPNVESTNSPGTDLEAVVDRDPALVVPPAPLTLGASSPIAESAPLTTSKHPTSPLTVRAGGPRSWKAFSQNVMAGLFLLGSVVILGRWYWARYQLHKLFVESLEVPAEVNAELRALAGNKSEQIRLQTSSQIVSPITWGIVRPIILLPKSLIDSGDVQALRFSLAHEWAHVSARDSGTWLIVNALQCVLYYNPLYWLLRRHLLLTMDQLADAQAAHCGDTPEDYAAFLVQLARAQQRQSPPLALAVSDPHSLLRKRVEFLIEHNPLARIGCTTTQHAMIAAGAILLVLLSTGIKLQPRTTINAQEQGVNTKSEAGSGAGQSAASQKSDSNNAELQDNAAAALTDIAARIAKGDKPSNAELLAAVVQDREGGSIVYHGFVLDRETALPIADVKVLVHHKLSRDPKTGDWSTLEVTEHHTNLQGMYSFTVPPEQASQSSLYLEVEAHHPKYASMGRAGYSHDMIRKNLKLGELPFYAELKLWPGTPVEGTLVSPDGKPVEGVEVSIYAKSSKVTGMMGGSFAKVKTDSQGQFRIVPPTPGDGVLWLKPDKYAPQAHRLADRRGDWGKITLEKGTDVPGQILDVDGQPVPNVRIAADRKGDGEKADEFLNANAVAGGIGRKVVSDAQGRFTLWALPEGEYTVTVEANSDSYDPPPLEQVFLHQAFKVSQDKAEPLTIRAVPFVVLHGTYLNSQNQPSRGHEVMAFGKLDEQFYFAQSSNPGKDGKFQLKLPHGIREVRLDLITNEHSALKWRKSRDQPLRRGRNVAFGTLEDDVDGFEIVRYNAPILLVKAVDSDGKIIEDAEPIIEYTRPTASEEEMVMYVSGSRVSFEKQGDGYHRSSQLLPDEPISVTIKKEGFTTTPQELKLGEGEEQRTEFVLVPAEKKTEKAVEGNKKAEEK